MPKLKCTLLTGKISSSPNIGSILGQRGLNIVDFSKAASEKTETYVSGKQVFCSVLYKPNKANKNNPFILQVGSICLYDIFIFLAEEQGFNIRWLYIIAKNKYSDFDTGSDKKTILILFGYLKSLQLVPYKL
jgi:hypothetical protein